ncbi:MAG: SH3 domain-containing protein, partial [Lachnospiraceae bacterium]|nr:SH3 domain-containing protein [Lachnospiraceae bacterium]
MKRKNGLRIATVAVSGAACIFVLSAGIIFAKGQKNNIRQIETPVAGMSVILGDFIENSGQTEVNKLLEINGVKKEDPKMDSPVSVGDDKEPVIIIAPEETTTMSKETQSDNFEEIANTTPEEPTTPEETTEPETTAEPQAESPYSGIAVAICDSYVNVRSGPGTEYKILGKIYKNCAAEILEESDGWYKMTSGNLTGYIKAEYFATGDEAGRLAEELGRKVGKVTASALRLRKEPSLDAK